MWGGGRSEGMDRGKAVQGAKEECIRREGANNTFMYEQDSWQSLKMRFLVYSRQKSSTCFLNGFQSKISIVSNGSRKCSQCNR
jgi:hypothetical protein